MTRGGVRSGCGRKPASYWKDKCAFRVAAARAALCVLRDAMQCIKHNSGFSIVSVHTYARV